MKLIITAMAALLGLSLVAPAFADRNKHVGVHVCAAGKQAHKHSRLCKDLKTRYQARGKSYVMHQHVHGKYKHQHQYYEKH